MDDGLSGVVSYKDSGVDSVSDDLLTSPISMAENVEELSATYGTHATPRRKLSLSSDSSILSSKLLSDNTRSSHNLSSLDSGVEDSPFLHYKYGELDKFVRNERSPSLTKSCFKRSSLKRVMNHDDQSSPSCPKTQQSVSQWTPEMKPLNCQKLGHFKTNVKLFPDVEDFDGSSQFRCSSPLPGEQHWSPEKVSDSLALHSLSVCSPLYLTPDNADVSLEQQDAQLYFTSSAKLSHQTSPPLLCRTRRNIFSTKRLSDLSPDIIPQPTSAETSLNILTVDNLTDGRDSEWLGVSEINSSPRRADSSGKNWFTNLSSGDRTPLTSPERRSVVRHKVDVSDGAVEHEKKGSTDQLHISDHSYEEDLLGDFSKSYCLPVVNGKHRDLKCITSSTLNDIIAGKYSDIVARFIVIDCRYPYEFSGGHIAGAINIYCQDQLIYEFFQNSHHWSSHKDTDKRSVIIFHCEFSSERAPKMMRFMRNYDRDLHEASYPALTYPELYLVDGGYRAFREQFGTLCEPLHGYVPMYDQTHISALQYYRSKQRSVAPLHRTHSACK